MEKTVLITGASEGIGRAFAKALATEGYTVTAVARNEANLKKLVGELGGKHKFIIADLSSSEGQDKIVKELSGGKYNLLINNAGVGTAGEFTDIAIDKQVQMVSLNCMAVLKLAYGFLKNSKPGDALINVSSTLAFLPMPGLGLYCATKAFVTFLSESLWFEQKKREVYVMGLCPGVTDTNFTINAGGKNEDIPAGMSQSPEQVVERALRALKGARSPTVISGAKNFLMSSLARFIPRKSAVNIMGKMTAGRMNPQ